MKKQLIYFFFALVLVASLQNCKYAKIDSIVNNSFEAGFTTIKAKGRIIDYKDGTPTAHGHCYSDTDEIPEIGLSGTKTTETPYVDVDFESKIDTLFFDKEYFVRPYMRNGDKIVYGEVQKIRTQTPNVSIKNFVVSNILTSPMTSDSIIEIEISTNEPSIGLPDNIPDREYGFVFGRADTLNITNELLTSTSASLFVARSPSPSIVMSPANNNQRNISLSLKRSNVNTPNRLTGIDFFRVGDPPAAPITYSVRAYLKLNKTGITKYYYSKRVTFRMK